MHAYTCDTFCSSNLVLKVNVSIAYCLRSYFPDSCTQFCIAYVITLTFFFFAAINSAGGLGCATLIFMFMLQSLACELTWAVHRSSIHRHLLCCDPPPAVAPPLSRSINQPPVLLSGVCGCAYCLVIFCCFFSSLGACKIQRVALSHMIEVDWVSISL